MRFKIIVSIFFICTINNFFAQIETITPSISDKQGVHYSNSLGNILYTSTLGNSTQWISGYSGDEIENCRYKFTHPLYTNDKIKKVVLNISYSKVSGSISGNATASVVMPKNSCNNSIPWNNNTSYLQDLYNCINTGDILLDNGISTDASINNQLITIVDVNTTNGLQSTNLQFFDPSSNNFTIGFIGLGGSITINSISAEITYICPTPSAPNLTATLGSGNNSSSTIQLDGYAVAGGTNYTFSPCNGSPSFNVQSTMNNSYTLTGLSSLTNYGIQVKATNICGISGNNSPCIFINTTIKAPTLAIPIAQSTSSILLNWTCADQNVATGYLIKQISPNSVTYPQINSGFSTNYLVTGLSSGTNYVFQIQTIAPNSANSSFATFNQTITYPDQPQNLVVTPGSITNSSVILTWNPVVGASSYQVFDCTSGLPLGSSTSSTTTYLTSLLPLTSYSLQVKAINAAGSSIGSSCANFTTLISPPTGLTTLALSTTSIQLNWTSTSSALNPIGYRIKQISPNTLTYSDLTPGTINTYTVTGLLAGTTYTFQIQTLANDPASNSQFISFNTTITYPDPPANLVATTVSGSKINLTWNSVVGASSYKVFRCDGTVVSGGTTTTNSFLVQNLAQLTYYDFKVIAVNAAGNSDYSLCVGATTLINEPTVTATPISTSKINVAWNNIPSAISYDIFDCNGIWLKNILAPPITTSQVEYNFSSLPSGTLYGYKVKTIGATSISIYSNCAQARTILDAPVLTEEVTSVNQITFTWNNVVGATSYDVYNCNGLYYTRVQTGIGTTSYSHTMNQLGSGINGIDIKVQAICPQTISNSAFSDCKAGFIAPACVPAINISGITFQYSKMYKSSGDITISNSTVNGGYAVVLESATKVIMNPTFTAQYGSFFQTSLIDCGNTNYRSMKINDTATDEIISSDNLIIFPNPSDGHYRIEVFNNEISEISIVDAFGAIVYQNRVDEISEIDISHLSNGLYFVKYKLNGTYENIKIIKQ